jgi:hypothetical protein
MKELEDSYTRSKSVPEPVSKNEVDEDEDDALSYFSKLVDM